MRIATQEHAANNLSAVKALAAEHLDGYDPATAAAVAQGWVRDLNAGRFVDCGNKRISPSQKGNGGPLIGESPAGRRAREAQATRDADRDARAVEETREAEAKQGAIERAYEEGRARAAAEEEARVQARHDLIGVTGVLIVHLSVADYAAEDAIRDSSGRIHVGATTERIIRTRGLVHAVGLPRSISYGHVTAAQERTYYALRTEIWEYLDAHPEYATSTPEEVQVRREARRAVVLPLDQAAEAASLAGDAETMEYYFRAIEAIDPTHRLGGNGPTIAEARTFFASERGREVLATSRANRGV